MQNNSFFGPRRPHLIERAVISSSYCKGHDRTPQVRVAEGNVVCRIRACSRNVPAAAFTAAFLPHHLSGHERAVYDQTWRHRSPPPPFSFFAVHTYQWFSWVVNFTLLRTLSVFTNTAVGSRGCWH